MADFVAVLRKTLDGLGDTNPETRSKVYDKARATIAAKLAAISPPPPAAVAERQKQALEEAIRTLEAEFAPPPAPKVYSDPIEELESVFASLGRPGSAPVKPAPAVSPPPKPANVAPAFAPRLDTAPKPRPQPKPDPVLDPEPAPEMAIDVKQPLPFEPLETGSIYETPRPQSRFPTGRLIGALVVLLALAGAGYGLWLNREDLSGLFRSASTSDPAASGAATPADQGSAPAPASDGGEPAAPAAAPEAPKFTQRLNEDGSEVDAGAAGGEPTLGEGTSVAAVTTPPPAAPAAPTPPAAAETPAAAVPAVEPPAVAEAPATDGQEPIPDAPAAADQTAAAVTPPAVEAPAPTPVETATVPVSQKAIFYEERTNVAEGSAAPGTIVWSLVQESPGADLPPEPAIRAEATIPGKDIQLRMTIRRNADKSLPASHIVEMIFLTPDGFEGGGIDNVLRMSMKNSEQEAGNPLIGIPAKIADGFFLVALNDTKAEIDANMTLLRRQSWIDVPLVYKSGRRALITMEKGIPGDKVFDEALKAWQAASG